MNNKFLQPLLQAGLLDIGDSDERLEHIEKSIADLEKKLKGDISLLSNYSLVSLDPNIPGEEPILEDVEKIVSEHWKALRAKFSERPVAILRAVILHALYNAGIEDAIVARIIYLTTSNFFPYAKVGREKDVVKAIIIELGEIAEAHANKEWALPDSEPSIKLPAFKFEKLKASVPDLDQEGLKQKLYESTSHSGTGLHAQNAQDRWANVFASGAAEGIVKILQNGLKGVAEGLDLTALSTSINKHLGTLMRTLDNSLKESFTSMRAVERRSKLLWWKETHYSAFLKDSYRSIPEICQPIVMALDLFQLVPDITPVSVDFLLKDTLHQLNHSAGTAMSISKLLEEINKPPNKELLKGCFDNVDMHKGRQSVTNFIDLLLHEKVSISDFTKYTGVEITEKISFADLAVTLLHDWMAVHLTKK